MPLNVYAPNNKAQIHKAKTGILKGELNKHVREYIGRLQSQYTKVNHKF